MVAKTRAKTPFGCDHGAPRANRVAEFEQRLRLGGARGGDVPSRGGVVRRQRRRARVRATRLDRATPRAPRRRDTTPSRRRDDRFRRDRFRRDRFRRDRFRIVFFFFFVGFAVAHIAHARGDEKRVSESFHRGASRRGASSGRRGAFGGGDGASGGPRARRLRRARQLRVRQTQRGGGVRRIGGERSLVRRRRVVQATERPRDDPGANRRIHPSARAISSAENSLRTPRGFLLFLLLELERSGVRFERGGVSVRRIVRGAQRLPRLRRLGLGAKDGAERRRRRLEITRRRRRGRDSNRRPETPRRRLQRAATRRRRRGRVAALGGGDARVRSRDGIGRVEG